MPNLFIPDDEPERHHNGAWKVAYADFVTALMALFIVLWLISAGKDVREAVSAYFRDPRGFSKLAGTAHGGAGEGLVVDAANVRTLQHKLERAMRRLPEFEKFAKYVRFSATGDGLRVELMESEKGLFFESGNARPSATGEELLGALAGELGRLTNEVVIEGHTDSVPYRDATLEAYSNWDLSVERANMARRAMQRHGLREGQITEVRGYADRRILIPESPVDSRNRRVSVVLKYSAAEKSPTK